MFAFLPRRKHAREHFVGSEIDRLPRHRWNARIDEVIQNLVEIADSLDNDFINLCALFRQSDQARYKRRRSVRICEEAVRQIADQSALGNSADYLQLTLAVIRRIIGELADARLRVIGGDEGEFVRVFAGAFDSADEYLSIHNFNFK